MPKADKQAITEEQENSSCVYGVQGGLEGLRTGVVPQQPGKRILRRKGSSKKRPNTCECRNTTMEVKETIQTAGIDKSGENCPEE